MRQAMNLAARFITRATQFKNHQDKLDKLISKWAFKPNRKYPLFSYIEVELYFHWLTKMVTLIIRKPEKLPASGSRKK